MPSTLIAAGIGTAELDLRLSRAPDFEGQSRALLRLASAHTGPRNRLLQGIADAALDLCCAGSAGISLIEQFAEGERCFRWLAVSGAFADLVARQQRGANAHAGSGSSLADLNCSWNPSAIFHVCRAARLRCPKD